MNEAQILIDSLKKKDKIVAMLAPSFPVVYEYPKIISKLKSLGFNYVVEVAAGAEKTNEQVVDALTKNPKSRFITSPCAGFVRLIRTKYPNFIQCLALFADSPMTATAKLVKERWPGFRPVFIGPCFAKKMESSEDHPDLNILVLTYKEMDEVFKNFDDLDTVTDTKFDFDIQFKKTRLYPISGGLSQSSGVKDILSEDEYIVVSGIQNLESSLMEFEKNQKIRLMDVLFCDGGCINGPGIGSDLTIDQRRTKIINFWGS